MAYTALYRKWRPDSFADVKGQDAIVTTLKNQSRMNRIGHAYLFCGTRGTGKTTVAKIFARAVNCEHPKDGEPCGECAACRAVARGQSMNVVEIDAASNNGVENIRELRDEVQYSPAEGRYRVYIIDEAHMLSSGASNALLKTLEEPPPYVIFILATTEPHKIPMTVKSRCQRYDFRRMTVDVITDRLTELTGYEQVEAEPEALRYIAGKADGAMRDAISLLDQCIAFHTGEKLTRDMVLSVLGAVDNEVFSRFLRGILRQDTASCLSLIDSLVMDGRELGQFVQDFIWYMRDLLLLVSSDVGSEILDLTKEDWMRLREEAAMTDPAGLIRLIRIFSDLCNQLRNAVNKRVLLEIAVIRTSQPEMEENLESLEERVSRLEKSLEESRQTAQETFSRLERQIGSGNHGSPSARTEPPAAAEPDSGAETVPLPPAEYADLMTIRNDWNRILAGIDRVSRASLMKIRLEPREEGTLCVVFSDKFEYNMCKQLGALDQVEDFVGQTYGKALKFEMRLAAAAEKAPRYVTEEELSQIFGGMDIEIEDDDNL